MKIISLSGKAGSGKDTAYELLSDYLSNQGYSCTKLSFANKLKDNLARMFYWDRQRLDNDNLYKESMLLDDGTPDPACKALGLTRRQVMQNYGTDAVRHGLHNDAWVITLQLDIQHGVYDKFDFGFITDARFLNELRLTHVLGGVTLQIQRIGEDTTLTNHSQHLSELEWMQWDQWDGIVENPVLNENQDEIEQSKHQFQNNLITTLSEITKLECF